MKVVYILISEYQKSEGSSGVTFLDKDLVLVYEHLEDAIHYFNEIIEHSPYSFVRTPKLLHKLNTTGEGFLIGTCSTPSGDYTAKVSLIKKILR